jgi:Na+/melibiose symporter-like transporter
MPNISATSRPAFRSIDYVKITVFGFALTALWQSIHTIILPMRLLDFVSESQKNTCLGLLTLSGLLLAMAVQPVAGAISDHSAFRWGRRRPYILVGTIAALIFLPGIGYTASYGAIFLIYCLLQLSTNAAQGPFQAFIPEFVPEGRRGRASGVKGLLEILGGAALVFVASRMMDRYAAGDGSHWLWLVLGILAIILLGAMLATILTVRERQIGVSSEASWLATLRRTFRIDLKANRDFLWFLLSRMLVFMAFTTIQQFALYFMQDVIGVAEPGEATANFTIVAIAAMVIVVWPAGYFSDRIGRKPTTIAAGLLGALGIAIIFASPSYGTILWAGGVIGVAMGIFNSTNWALATDLVVKGEEARYLAITNMATAGGAALARLVGIGIDFFNNRSPNAGYDFMLIVCIVYFVAGAAAVMKIRTKR